MLDWRRLTNLTLNHYRPRLSKVKLWQRALTPSKNRLCCLTRMERTGKPRHRRGGPKGERVPRVNQQAQPPLAEASFVFSFLLSNFTFRLFKTVSGWLQRLVRWRVWQHAGQSLTLSSLLREALLSVSVTSVQWPVCTSSGSTLFRRHLRAGRV